MSGFRAAEAFVEVTARLDDSKVTAAARRAAGGMDRTLADGGRKAGAQLTSILERAGNDAGVALVGKIDGRMRDSRGRFIGAGVKISEDVRKGGADDFDRSGFSMFLGLIKAGPKAGKELAGGMLGAVKGGFGGPIGPYLAGTVAAAAIVAGPLAGGLLAGGILAGAGAAGIGAGVALMIKDPQIQHAAGLVGEDIGDTLKSAAEPFRAEMLTAIRSGGLAFDRWTPQIRTIMATSSTMLNPLVNGVIRMVDNLMPGFVKAVKAAELPIKSIANGLSGTGKALGDMFDKLSDNGPEAALALDAAFFLVNSTIDNVAWTVNALTEALGWMMNTASALGGWLRDAGDAMKDMPGPLGAIGEELTSVGNMIGSGTEQWERYRAAGTDAAKDAAAETKALDERTKFLSLSMGAAIKSAGGLSAAFKLLNGGALSAREAESAYQAAIDAVTESIKVNGKTLDLHTAKGRANDQAIRDLIATTDRKAQATYDEILATKGAAAAETAARGVYEQGRAQLVKNLTQILGNSAAARKMADQIMSIPKSWGTTINLTDMASKKAQAIKYQISTIHGKTVVVAVKYETRGRAPGEHIIGQGTQLRDRWGGVHEDGLTRARDGVVRDAAMFGPRSPGHYLVAEPETGGELFAPRRGDMRRIKAMVSYAIENWWGGWEGFMPRRGQESGSTAPVGSSPGRAAGPWGGGASVVNIGTVTLDASGMKSIQDVVDLVSNLRTTARSQRARVAAMPGR